MKNLLAEQTADPSGGLHNHTSTTQILKMKNQGFGDINS